MIAAELAGAIADAVEALREVPELSHTAGKFRDAVRTARATGRVEQVRSVAVELCGLTAGASDERLTAVAEAAAAVARAASPA